MITETISCDGIPKLISRIGLGTWAIGGAEWGRSNDTDSIKTIQHAVDVGINLIDTAPVYGFGHSEEIVGQALAEGGRRDKAVLATKVALEWADGKVFRNSSPARIRKEIEDSLRRLRTDRIDIYQIHWPDSTVPIEETAEAMLELHREGKVLALGVSNFSPQQMEAWRRVAPLHSTQPPYNIFERDIESDVLPYALDKKLIVLSYGAICRGLLSGKMSRARKFEESDLRLRDPKFLEPRFFAVPGGGRSAGETCTDKLRKECTRLCGQMDPRSRRNHDCPLGRPERRTTRPGRGSVRVEDLRR